MFNPHTSFRQLLNIMSVCCSEAEDAQTPYLIQCFYFKLFPTEWPRASLWLLVCFWPVIKDNSGLCELILHVCGCCVGRANFELFTSVVVIRQETEVVFREIQAPKVVWKKQNIVADPLRISCRFLGIYKEKCSFLQCKNILQFPPNCSKFQNLTETTESKVLCSW